MHNNEKSPEEKKSNATPSNMCILEDMQPLYYFNVKTNKNGDELGQEER